jgi:hypothetical protein
MKNRSLFALLVALFVSSFTVGLACSPPEDEDNPDATVVEEEALAITATPPDSAHFRVIQECSWAMVGNHDTYNVGNWPTGTTYATYAYASADNDAWNMLRTAYSRCPTSTTCTLGFFVSCLYKRANGYLPSPYAGCQLSLTTGYGSSEMPGYACQGNSAGGFCPSGTRSHGGQCKAFMNLVAYRSGIYQLSGHGFKTLPSDDCIANTTNTCSLSPKQWVTRPIDDKDMPLATYDNVVEGDFLRMPYDHAIIVVKKLAYPNIVVLDSNYLNNGTGHGDGKEIIGSHPMGFTGGHDHNDLGSYRVLRCVYTGKC